MALRWVTIISYRQRLTRDRVVSVHRVWCRTLILTFIGQVGLAARVDPVSPWFSISRLRWKTSAQLKELL